MEFKCGQVFLKIACYIIWLGKIIRKTQISYFFILNLQINNLQSNSSEKWVKSMYYLIQKVSFSYNYSKAEKMRIFRQIWAFFWYNFFWGVIFCFLKQGLHTRVCHIKCHQKAYHLSFHLRPILKWIGFSGLSDGSLLTPTPILKNATKIIQTTGRWCLDTFAVLVDIFLDYF